MSDLYELAPGIEVVPVGEDAVVLRSDAVRVRLEGTSAVTFGRSVLPSLRTRRSLAEIAGLVPGLTEAELRPQLDSLVDAGALRRTPADSPPFLDSVPAALRPFASMLEALGLPLDKAIPRLRDMHVAVFGLEAHGTYVADLLVRLGVGRLTLVDPFVLHAENAALAPLLGEGRPGEPRQSVVKRALDRVGLPAEIAIPPGEGLTRDQVRALANGASFLVGCFDRGFVAAHHWLNRASLEHSIPCIFGELRGHRLIAGPLVLPRETACYMCWRMRSASCEGGFGDAMAYEEHLDRLREPGLHRRATLPPASAWLGSLLALEIVKAALAIGRPSLASRVHELDLLSNESSLHTVLQRPDCPVCRPTRVPPPRPPLSGLGSDEGDPGAVLRASADLVSPHCGVVRSLTRVTKDPSEPAAPYVFRAELANHRFSESLDEAFMICSGKGPTLEDARSSALGEAIERYAGTLWSDESTRRATRADLEGPSLDPRRLVLYPEDQYDHLPYRPYTDSSTLGWVEARSLTSGHTTQVPAIAVYLGYECHAPEEFLFPATSSGLAAGPTLAQAILAAACEVIERDAFLAMWLLRLPCVRVDPLTHPDPAVVDLCLSYRRRGVTLELYRIPMDHRCAVFAAVGVEPEGKDGPAAVVGLGAGLDPARAARSAVFEVGQVRPALRGRLRDPATKRRLHELLEEPSRVATLEDHDLLYASPAMLRSFDFLRRSPLEEQSWTGPGGGASTHLEALVNDLEERGTEVLYCNLTTEDVGQRGLHVARVLIPDFQPIYFGEAERRLGGDRLFELPRLLGLQPTPAALSDLNADPHPLA